MENVEELLERLEKLEHEVAEARAARAEQTRHAAMLERLRHPLETLENLESHLESLDKLGAHAKSIGGQPAVPVRVAVGESDVVAVPSGAGGDAGEWWAAIRDFVSRTEDGS